MPAHVVRSLRGSSTALPLGSRLAPKSVRAPSPPLQPCFLPARAAKSFAPLCCKPPGLIGRLRCFGVHQLNHPGWKQRNSSQTMFPKVLRRMQWTSFMGTAANLCAPSKYLQLVDQVLGASVIRVPFLSSSKVVKSLPRSDNVLGNTSFSAPRLHFMTARRNISHQGFCKPARPTFGHEICHEMSWHHRALSRKCP